ncbi:hypothetical protein GQ457_01G034570 [Hibiscus cannabinus]
MVLVCIRPEQHAIIADPTRGGHTGNTGVKPEAEKTVAQSAIKSTSDWTHARLRAKLKAWQNMVYEFILELPAYS